MRIRKELVLYERMKRINTIWRYERISFFFCKNKERISIISKNKKSEYYMKVWEELILYESMKRISIVWKY